MLDRWYEIFDTLWRHKLRTCLTALSVAWGIFMLVILLGAGTGLQNQVEYGFRDDALNSLWIRPGRTTEAFEGYKVGRQIQFDNDDFDSLLHNIDRVEHITGRVFIRGNTTVRYGDKHSAFDTRAVHPGHLHLENTIITRGRFVTDTDLDERRKVAVLGNKVVEHLFGSESANPIGERIDIGGIPYLVVGTFTDTGGEGEQRKIYIPISTAQTAYGAGRRQDMIMFTVGDANEAETLATVEQTRRLLASRKHFSPTDERAARVFTPIENVKRVRGVFTGIRIFIWIVGIGTIIAGIVGVSNIMLISVKERTKEFGIRKALGATPGSIIALVVQEALLLTGLAGYLGLLTGVGLLHIVTSWMPENDYIRDPQVDLGVAISATMLLVLAGVLAGFFPARRAARVNPVVALRDE